RAVQFAHRAYVCALAFPVKTQNLEAPDRYNDWHTSKQIRRPYTTHLATYCTDTYPYASSRPRSSDSAYRINDAACEPQCYSVDLPCISLQVGTAAAQAGLHQAHRAQSRSSPRHQ